MKILQIEARDIVLTFEISLSELEKIRLALDYAELRPLNADIELREETKEASKFLTEVVYPFIMKAIEGMKGSK